MNVSLQDRIEALEHLVLAHIIASGRALPGTTHAAIEQADAFAEQLDEDGKQAAAVQLLSLANTLRALTGPRRSV